MAAEGGALPTFGSTWLAVLGFVEDMVVDMVATDEALDDGTCRLLFSAVMLLEGIAVVGISGRPEPSEELPVSPRGRLETEDLPRVCVDWAELTTPPPPPPTLLVLTILDPGASWLSTAGSSVGSEVTEGAAAFPLPTPTASLRRE